MRRRVSADDMAVGGGESGPKSRRRRRHPAALAGWLPLLLLALGVMGGARAAGDLSDDAAGLALFNRTFYPQLGNAVQWTASNVCDWDGVKCGVTKTSNATRVTSVRLPSIGLEGEIPAGSLGRLTDLRVLSLHSNKLSGPLPSDLSDNCTFLRTIYLHRNSFSGSLPPLSGSIWPNLLHFDASVNNFSGQIPSTVVTLSRLKSLFLQNNSLSGSLPPINISSLANFSVAFNSLQGPIPSSLAGFGGAAFLGNNLCGFPLPACAAPPSPSPSASSPTQQEQHRKRKLSAGAIAGIVIACVIALLLLLAVCILVASKRKAQAKESKEAAATTAPRAVGEAAGGGSKPEYGGAGTSAGEAAAASAAAAEADRNKLVFFQDSKYAFDLEDLLRASAEVLGKGSVGTAYKAVLENGAIVAVKRLKDVTIERKEFEQQIAPVGRLRHDHLVPLVAYYYSKEEKLLVNEYMTNGSLSALLHGNKGTNRTPLDWDTRVKITLGAARGIDYLHDQGFYHGNIKSSNILLTNNYNSCVSDYGLVQLVSATPAASRIVGYRAPEVTDIKRISTKADVYSFGVLLLELLTGKAPSQASTSDDAVDLPQFVQNVPKDLWSSKVFDPELMAYGDREDDMGSLLELAMQCVAPSPDQRPTMKQVVRAVESIKLKNGGLDDSIKLAGASPDMDA